MFALITLIFIVYSLFRQLNRKKYLGKLLLQVPGDFNSRSSMFLFMFIGCLWVFILIAGLTKVSPYYTGYISNLISPVIWIILCFINILGIKYDKEIRENGIIIRQDYVYWSDIINYEWVEDERLKITFRSRILKKVTKVWTIDPSDKEKIDMIFNRYVNIKK